MGNHYLRASLREMGGHLMGGAKQANHPASEPFWQYIYPYWCICWVCVKNGANSATLLDTGMTRLKKAFALMAKPQPCGCGLGCHA